ncbi:suppressor of fused domain protein [Variovorax sp. ZS18.2.2]|uniref:suppressor of fused domain protein n=1 Tax=Variovorax sp. ZS18.2.2 TaxID=2971255 RepID=UPI0021511D85|nr:suppressor of fused domain protein [Variovorax sp. ZS18.2.2]MCR6480630.1 suppressor of fused domain protein [Variovorax sp. ZS18.2.2]
MFNRLKKAFGGGTAGTTPTRAQLRLQAMLDALASEPEQTFLDSADAEHRVDIHAFGRNFVEGSQSANDEGYVLVTNGMSDRLMPMPSGGLPEDASRAVELIWYVRDLNPEYISNLRWLAKLPAFDRFFLGFGHRVPMPEPPLSFCGFQTFFFLSPIYGPDARMLSGVTVDEGEAIATLTVNLISEAEYALVKREGGFGELLDLFDANDHPMVFDPQRSSYV